MLAKIPYNIHPQHEAQMSGLLFVLRYQIKKISAYLQQYVYFLMWSLQTVISCTESTILIDRCSLSTYYIIITEIHKKESQIEVHVFL